MIIYKDKFQNEHNDTIAVIYELNSKYSYDGTVNLTRKAIKKNPLCNAYFLLPNEKYLILCGRSTWMIDNNELTCTYVKKDSDVII